MIRGNRDCELTCSSDLFEATGRVLVQQARDQRLIRQAFGERPLLNRLGVLARQADVQPSVLLERRLCVAGEARSFALAATGGLPLARFDGLEQLLLFGVNLHRPDSSVRYCFVAFRLGTIVFRNTECSSSTSASARSATARAVVMTRAVRTRAGAEPGSYDARRTHIA